MLTYADVCWRMLTYADVCQDDVAAGLNSGCGAAWPSGGDLLLLISLPALFPISDFEHAVTTPYVLTLAQVSSRILMYADVC
jgi:hypothetical protein